ncbi:MAG: DUF6279 family lipoprotein [Caldimonas sp.]
MEMFARIQSMGRIIGRPYIVLALVLAAVLNGCSLLRVGYDQAPTLVYWRLDRLAGFTPAQAPRVREAIGQWFAWHRREELPRYAEALARLQQEILQDTTASRACRWLDELSAWRDTAWDRAVPLLVPLARDLDADQLERLAQRLQRDDEALRREMLPEGLAARAQAQVQRAVQRAQRLYGRLDAEQRAWLAQALAEARLDPEVWFAERQRRQADLLETLARLREHEAGPPQTQAALHAVYRRAIRPASSSPAPQAAACGLLAGLHNRTTAAQRHTAARRLRDWEADLRALASDSPRPTEHQAQSGAESPLPR